MLKVDRIIEAALSISLLRKVGILTKREPHGMRKTVSKI